MRTSSRALVVAVVLATAGAGAPAGAGQATCRSGDLLLRAGQVGQALDVYAAAQLGPCPRLAQARRRERVAELALARGATLERRGAPARARRQYVRALRADPSLAAASTALARLAGVTPPPPGLAGTAGADEADTITLDTAIRDWALGVFDTLGKLLYPVALVAVLAALATLLAALLMRSDSIAGRLRRRVSRYDLEASPPRGRPWRPLLRHIAATPLQVDAFDGDDGGAAAAALSAALPRVGGQRKGVDVVTASYGAHPILKSAADAIKDAPKGGTIVSGALELVRALLPQEVLHLSGRVLASPTRGPGLALGLRDARGRVMGATTIWVADFEGPGVAAAAKATSDGDRLQRLALAGASWTAFAVLAHRGLLALPGARRRLGTIYWESFALLQCGALAGAAKTGADREALYARARDKDPEHLAARLNLAVAYARLDRHAAARDLLTAIDSALENPGPDPEIDRHDLLRFPVAYNRAASVLNEHLADPTAATRAALAPERDHLAGHILDLDRELHHTARVDDRHATLASFSGPMLLVWAGLQQALDRVAPPASGAPTPPAPDNATTASLLKAHDRLGVVARVAARPSLDSRTSYDLACFHAQETDPGARDRAFALLAQALSNGRYGEWVGDDPSFEPLRDDPRWKAILEAAPGGAPARTGLGLLDAVAGHEDRLRGIGIADAGQLVTRAQSPPRRRALAAALGVAPPLVERWARLAELQLRVALTTAEVNQLDAVGIATVDDLADLHAPQVAALLHLPPADAQRPVAWVASALQARKKQRVRD